MHLCAAAATSPHQFQMMKAHIRYTMMSTSRLRSRRCQHAGSLTAAMTTVLKPAEHNACTSTAAVRELQGCICVKKGVHFIVDEQIHAAEHRATHMKSKGWEADLQRTSRRCVLIVGPMTRRSHGRKRVTTATSRSNLER